MIFIDNYRKKLYRKSNINPDSITGLEIISKTILANILEDCEPSFRSDYHYGLESETFGHIQVKCADLVHNNTWSFRDLDNKYINYYFLFGYDKYKTEILKVWCISASDLVIKHTKLRVHNNENGCKRLVEYELDAEVFNNELQNLDLVTIPEFMDSLPNRTDSITQHQYPQAISEISI